jgi:DTW domain-containing protein YfiP
MSSAPSRPDCLRPTRACVCAWAVPTANQVSVLPLRLSLAGHALAVGEAFPPHQLQSLLHGSEPGKAQPVLLYPEAPGVASFVPDPDGPPPRPVVLDATWRKSRKMLALNPALHALPRLSLAAPPPSQYLIRKAHKPGQLSTLEAVCHALAQLEGNAARYQPLLRAFDGFVAQQLAFREAAADTNPNP